MKTSQLNTTKNYPKQNRVAWNNKKNLYIYVKETNRRHQRICIDSGIQSNSEVQAFPKSRMREGTGREGSAWPVHSTDLQRNNFLPARRAASLSGWSLASSSHLWRVSSGIIQHLQRGPVGVIKVIRTAWMSAADDAMEDNASLPYC